MSIIKVGGIDPSLRATGFGIIEYDNESEEISIVHCGVVRTPEKYKKFNALLYTIEGMMEIAKRPEWKECDNIVIEFPVAIYQRPITPGMSESAIKRNQIRGFSAGTIPPVAGVAGACVAAFQKKDRVIPVAPATWNRARKKDVTKGILIEYLGEPDSWQWDFPCSVANQEHVFDALGVAFWLLEEHFFEYPDK